VPSFHLCSSTDPIRSIHGDKSDQIRSEICFWISLDPRANNNKRLGSAGRVLLRPPSTSNFTSKAEAKFIVAMEVSAVTVASHDPDHGDFLADENGLGETVDAMHMTETELDDAEATDG
jgi:hypothetical protein